MVDKRRPKPIPREEPEDEGSEVARPAREPTTLRPPKGGGEDVSTYQKLRESCRSAASEPAAENASTDEELAIEAEIVSLALARNHRPKR